MKKLFRGYCEWPVKNTWAQRLARIAIKPRKSLCNGECHVEEPGCEGGVSASSSSGGAMVSATAFPLLVMKSKVDERVFDKKKALLSELYKDWGKYPV